MRELLLLRHAKSAWADPALDDHERPLNRRGQQAADLMGRYLLERGLLPDLALVSSAARTQETWAKLCKVWQDAAPDAKVLEELYLAPPGQILTILRAAPAAVRRLLVLGHNPGMERLAERLAGKGSDAESLGKLNGKFPTGALARLQFSGADWSVAAEGKGRLVAFVTPADLEPA